MFGKRRIYADAAAATPLSREAQARLLELLPLFGNPGAIHSEGVNAVTELAASRSEAATALEAHPDEIVFTASGTEANNLALFGVCTEPLEKLHVITSSIEHPSILEPLKVLEARGLSVTYLPVSAEGEIDYESLAEAITEKTRLITIGLINSEIGTITDVRAIAKLVRRERKNRTAENPLYLHVDAAQAPLWVRLRVEALGCDLMTLDAQKIMGPKGVGLLYVRRGTTLSPHIVGGGQEGGVRSGTENVPLIGAFARALSIAQKECEENSVRIAPVRDTLLSLIKKELPDARVNGSEVHRVANNLNISIPGLVGERAVIALSAYGVAASTRSACATKDEDLSHVLLALYSDAARAKEAIRFTLLPSATEGEMRRIAEHVGKAARLYRNIDATI